jgi:thioredoxin 1
MKVKEVNQSNFDKEISSGKVLVDFNATWCGPCRMLAPILGEFSETSKVKVCSVDVDSNEDIARKYGIMSIPCLILFENGKAIKRSVGLLVLIELKKFVGE